MTNQPKKVFESFRESMLSKTDEWMTLISEGVFLIGPLAQVRGKKGFIEINKPFFESIRGSEILEVIETGNYIITQITTDVEMPTGKVITLHVCEWYEIQENKIKSLKIYFDTAQFINEMKPV
ncbi:MAG: nuclear transport factor 2 family protein [Bacteroidetes bacterium]|nr:nuclear transport factor 2 family protein [Bacteroidota bacterium]